MRIFLKDTMEERGDNKSEDKVRINQQALGKGN